MAKKKNPTFDSAHRDGGGAQTLGAYLSSIRTIRRMTLREVEEASSQEVSNAYLSQLEKNKISQPSPNILRSLAQVYVIPYDTLMEKAGYFSPTVASNEALRSASMTGAKRAESFAAANLTHEEEESLLEYLAFLRSEESQKEEILMSCALRLGISQRDCYAVDPLAASSSKQSCHISSQYASAHLTDGLEDSPIVIECH